MFQCEHKIIVPLSTIDKIMPNLILTEQQVKWRLGDSGYRYSLKGVAFRKINIAITENLNEIDNVEYSLVCDIGTIPTGNMNTIVINLMKWPTRYFKWYTKDRYVHRVQQGTFEIVEDDVCIGIYAKWGEGSYHRTFKKMTSEIRDIEKILHWHVSNYYSFVAEKEIPQLATRLKAMVNDRYPDGCTLAEINRITSYMLNQHAELLGYSREDRNTSEWVKV